MDLPEIRSRSHPLLKRVRAVRAGKERATVVLEGERLILDALRGGVELEALLMRTDVEPIDLFCAHPECRQVEPGALDGVSGLATPPGWIALAKAPPELPLAGLEVRTDTLLLSACGLSDPGNLGALARVAEAAGAAGVAIGPGGARPSNEKALRGSMGSLLRLPIYRLEDSAELQAAGLRTVVAATRGGVDYRDLDWDGPRAIWIGSETGASSLEPPADALRATIPMAGSVESLNAATAATLLLFEAARHRR
ncbi:MAG: TrmH family RNA methyltransferase [Planctomycetota bacterium]|jgi:TrmH family RNA methyltransferase